MIIPTDNESHCECPHKNGKDEMFNTFDNLKFQIILTQMGKELQGREDIKAC